MQNLKPILPPPGSIIKQISLNIAEFHALGQVFKQVSLGAQPKDKGWEVAFLMPDVDGKIYFPQVSSGVIKGEFKKLYFGESQKTLSTLKPQDLSPLNLKIDNLRYGNKYFNRVIFITEPQSSGVKINKIAFSGIKI